MIKIVKPIQSDIEKIEEILTQWTETEEVDKYVERIKNEIGGIVEFNTHYWVAKEGDRVLGIIGLSDPLPKVLPFAKTDKPGEIKILYVDKNSQGKGVGRMLVDYIELEAKNKNYKELIVRSADKYKNTAWGFYKKMGYEEVGKLDEGEKRPMQVFEKKLA